MKWYGDKPVPAKLRPLEGRSYAQFADGQGNYFESRDERGVEIHWAWLHAKWNAIYYRLLNEEQRGLYGTREEE